MVSVEHDITDFKKSTWQFLAKVFVSHSCCYFLEGVMAHLLKQLLDPLGLVDSDEIRQMMMTAAATEAAKDGEATAQSAKEFIKAVMEGDVKRVAEALKKNKGFVNNCYILFRKKHLIVYRLSFPMCNVISMYTLNLH